MDYNQSSDEGKISFRKWWIVIFCISIFLLALLWSVDKSIFYILLAVSAFSLFKIFEPHKTESDQSTSSYNSKYEKSYEQYRPSAFSLFLDDIKKIFRKDSPGSRTIQTPQQSRVFVILIAGFIGFIFFITIVVSFFGNVEPYDSSYQRASDYYTAQQYDSAAYYYRLAILTDPDNPDLYFERGNAFLNAGKTDSALVLYDLTLNLNPTHQQAQYNKGYIYFDRKDYRMAMDETRKILEYAPDYTDAMLLLGDSFYNQSQLDSALRWYNDAYSLGVRSAVLCHLMAYIYDTKGQTQTAITLYKEAIGRDSSIVDIYTRLGELVPGEEGNWYRTKAATMK